MNELENKPKCFIIQLFDEGIYDRRYNESIKPALVKAGVDPIRADEILGPKPVVEKIENAIRETDICLAEISTDNPNVWLEVGYAYSLDKPTLLLCDKNIRTALPFDIRHRPVIFYTTQYKSGFDDLERKIIKEIGEFLRHAKGTKKTENVTNQIAHSDLGALSIEAQLLLFLLADNQVSDPSGMSGWQIKNKWQDYGVSKEKISFAVATLSGLNYIQEAIKEDYNGEEYKTYSLTTFGSAWVAAHPELYDKVIPSIDNRIPF